MLKVNGWEREAHISCVSSTRVTGHRRVAGYFVDSSTRVTGLQEGLKLFRWFRLGFSPTRKSNSEIFISHVHTDDYSVYQCMLPTFSHRYLTHIFILQKFFSTRECYNKLWFHAVKKKFQVIRERIPIGSKKIPEIVWTDRAVCSRRRTNLVYESVWDLLKHLNRYMSLYIDIVNVHVYKF